MPSALPRFSLRHRLEVQKLVPGDVDEYGGEQENWATERAIWGDIRPSRSAERVESARVQGYRALEIVVRFDAGLTPAHRLKHNGRVFQIDGLYDVDERRRFMRVMASEAIG